LIVFELERYPSRTLDVKGGTVCRASAFYLFTVSPAETAAAKLAADGGRERAAVLPLKPSCT